jgi:hypothetical protein
MSEIIGEEPNSINNRAENSFLVSDDYKVIDNLH